MGRNLYLQDLTCEINVKVDLVANQKHTEELMKCCSNVNQLWAHLGLHMISLRKKIV